MLSSSVRAAAAAPRRLDGSMAVKVEELPAAIADTETFVSIWAAPTWSIDRPSSSPAIWSIAVGEPCPISVQPWKRVTVLSRLICSQESIWAGSGGPGTLPVCADELAARLFEARATLVEPRASATAPEPFRNDLRENSGDEPNVVMPGMVAIA